MVKVQSSQELECNSYFECLQQQSLSFRLSSPCASSVTKAYLVRLVNLNFYFA